MHYLPFGARLNKCIIMVTQLILGFSAHLNQRELFPLGNPKDILKHICLGFASFLPLFYFCCIYYFGSLIFCCQFVAISL